MGTPDGKTLLIAKQQIQLKADETDDQTKADMLGKMVAQALIKQGADVILQTVYHNHQKHQS